MPVVNMRVHEDVLAYVDEVARREGLTRTALLLRPFIDGPPRNAAKSGSSKPAAVEVVEPPEPVVVAHLPKPSLWSRLQRGLK